MGLGFGPRSLMRCFTNRTIGKRKYVKLFIGVLVSFIILSIWQSQSIINHLEENQKQLKRLHSPLLSDCSPALSVPLQPAKDSQRASVKRKSTKQKLALRGLKSRTTQNDSKLLFLGIFTRALDFQRRRWIRESYLKMKSVNMDIYFVIETPKRAALKESVDREQNLYGDLMILKDEVEPVIDKFGNTTHYPCIKAYTFFHQVYTRYASGNNSRLVDFPYKYIMKADDDVWIHLPNLEKRLSLHRYDRWVYFGRQVARKGFMSGMGYVLSRDWVKYISTVPVTTFQPLPYGPLAYKYTKIGQEDAIIGAWILSSRKKMKWLSEEKEFYDHPDYNKGWAHPFTPDSILIHQINDEQAFKKTTQHFIPPKP